MTEELTITEQPSVLKRMLDLLDKGQPLPALTLDELDECLAEFEQRELDAAAGEKRVKAAKVALITLVRAHGSVPPDAAQSKRLVGRRNIATVTVGNSTTVFEPAVDDLGTYCAEHKLDGIFERLFATEVSHKLIDGARNVLGTVQLPKRTHEKLLSLFGRCFDVKPKAPSLTVSVIKPEKPARKPRRKQAA